MPFAVPNGYEEIVHAYGNPEVYRSSRAQMIWQHRILTSVTLPFAVSFIGTPTTEVYVHRKIASVVQGVFRDVKDANLEALVQELNGTYAFRARIADPSQFSIRTFGAAIDLNASGEQDPRIVDIFKARGFQWGDDFAGMKEPSLFALCAGYEG